MPVLARSLSEYGDPRPVVPGTYHLTDLLWRPALDLAEEHLGLEEPKGIPPWLAARGKTLEDALFSGVALEFQQPELVYNVPGLNARIVGHPDYIEDQEDVDDDTGEITLVRELGEGKTQLNPEDDAREDLGLYQGNGYTALCDAGAEIRWRRPNEHGELVVWATEVGNETPIDRINIVMGGFWEPLENPGNGGEPYPVDRDITQWLHDWMVRKVHALEACRTSGKLGPARDWDAENTTLDVQEEEPVPEGELAETAEAAMDYYVQSKASEAALEDLKKRLEATLEYDEDDKSKRKLKVPTGGSISLARNPAPSQRFDRAKFHDEGGPELEEQVKHVREAKDELVEAAVAELREAQPGVFEKLEELEAELEELRGACTTLEQGVHVRFYPPKERKVWLDSA